MFTEISRDYNSPHRHTIIKIDKNNNLPFFRLSDWIRRIIQVSPSVRCRTKLTFFGVNSTCTCVFLRVINQIFYYCLQIWTTVVQQLWLRRSMLSDHNNRFSSYLSLNHHLLFFVAHCAAENSCTASSAAAPKLMICAMSPAYMGQPVSRSS